MKIILDWFLRKSKKKNFLELLDLKPIIENSFSGPYVANSEEIVRSKKRQIEGILNYARSEIKKEWLRSL